MADYIVQTAENVTVVLSPTQVMEMTRFGIVTQPSGVLFYVNIPVKGATAQAASVSLEQWALSIEAAMRLEGVVAGRWAQDADGSNLLADYLVLTVEYDTGDLARPGPYQQEVWVKAIGLSAPTAFGTYVAQPVAQALAFLAGVVNG